MLREGCMKRCATKSAQSRLPLAVVGIGLAVLPAMLAVHASEPLPFAAQPGDAVAEQSAQPELASGWGNPVELPAPAELPPANLKQLMRPNFTLAAEWQGKSQGIGLAEYEARVSVPTYPVFGPPPPMIHLGFATTQLEAPGTALLPTDLMEADFGLAWMRPLSERWMVRVMAGASVATDGDNQSSDVWRFRGGAFAIYRRNPQWTWTFGAIALGRNDLPVLPAVGVIYQPNSRIRFDLLMPRPRIACLLVDNGARQQWGYLGMALNGTTWGVHRGGVAHDQLTYGDVRLAIGWEATPRPEPGLPFTRGRKFAAELGYVFSRDFEWESDGLKIPLDDALMLSASVSF